MTTGATRSRENWLLLVASICFFTSGAAGLIYQVVWTRMLTQIFGNTTYAIATVLAAFMAGLAIGSYIFGRIADRGKNDFLLYGILEAGVGIYGLAVPWLFDRGRLIYIPLFSLNDSNPMGFNLLLFALAFVLLVLPTLLMGATMPVLSRFFVKSFTQLGRRVGDLYATNTLGAVIGCGFSGYYLIPAFGMRATVYVAAALNLVIALMIFIVDGLRDKSAAIPAEAEEPEPNDTGSVEAPSTLGWVVLVAFGFSGMAALVYENAWTRALTLVIGSSVYSFTTMLVTFLIGLALGGFLYARWLGERKMWVSTFGVIELVVGFAALATIPLFEKLPLIFLRLHEGFGDSFYMFLSIQVLLAGMVMFIPTVLLGMTFPLVARLFTQSIYRVGSSVGISYAANTLGAIVGAFAGGFILIPLIGVQQSILAAVVVNLVIGWLLLVMDPRLSAGPRAALGLIVIVASGLIWFKTPRWDQAILTSGVTIYSDRYENLHTDSLRLEHMRADPILFYREGLTATVSVHQSVGSEYRYFKTNGKVDGSYGDTLSQLMTGYIPMLFHPGGERAAVIGLGTGMTAKAVASFPFKEIEVLEIEPAMIKSARFFDTKNGKVLDDPRVRIIPTDGRNYILATPKVYDVITAEPSNPWIAGIANLYTREFYEIIKSKLKPGGVFAQWFHNYSMSPDDFHMVFRTFAQAFPHVSVWGMRESDFLMVGTQQEQSFDYPRLKEVFANNKTMREDFTELGLTDPYAALGFYRMGRKEVMAFTEGAALNTDDGAELEFSAPKSLGRATSELNRKLMGPHLADAPWLKMNPAPLPEALRHFHLAQGMEANDWHERALGEIDQAIKLDPSNADFYVLKTKILLAQDKSAEGAESALAAMARSPQTIKAILDLSGEFYLPEAKVVYGKAIELGYREIAPYLGLGKIALHRHELEEAEKWFGLAKQTAGENKDMLLWWGRLHLAKGEAEKAKDFLEQAKTTGEDSDVLYGALGETYSKLEQWEQAAGAYREALRRKRNVDWRRSLGIALAKLGRVREAEEKFREVLATRSDDTEAWKELGKIGKRY